MAISDRIVEATEKYNANDPVGALIPASIAIDATATKLYGKPGRGSFKYFIKDNMLLISKAGMNGRQIENLNLQVPPEFIVRWPDMKADTDRLCGLP